MSSTQTAAASSSLSRVSANLSSSGGLLQPPSQPRGGVFWQSNDFTDVLDRLTFTSQPCSAVDVPTAPWTRRMLADFFARYTQYLQQSVAFRLIGTTAKSHPLSFADSKTDAEPTCFYALLHRAIHLAGVHIIEVSVAGRVCVCIAHHFQAD